MRNLTELFDYVKNTSQDDLMKKVKFVVTENSEKVLIGLGRLNSVLTYINYYLMIPQPFTEKREDNIMTIKEACSYLKLNDKTVRKLINQRKRIGFVNGSPQAFFPIIQTLFVDAALFMMKRFLKRSSYHHQ